MNARTLTRIAAAGAVGLAFVVGLIFAGATSASADTDERNLSLTRLDGSPIGTLFTDWTMVPGDVVRTTVVAHRTGGDESSLLITLGNSSGDRGAASTAVEEDVVITIASNGSEYISSAAASMKGDVVFDLGRSSAEAVPIDVTFELPYSSGNDTQGQSIDLSLTVTAIDPSTPDGLTIPGFPNLPTTGASVRDLLIAAAVLTSLGLLLIGKRRRRDEEG